MKKQISFIVLLTSSLAFGIPGPVNTPYNLAPVYSGTVPLVNIPAMNTGLIAEGGGNFYHTATRADARISVQKAQPNGIATLGSDGKIPNTQIPSLAISDTFVVASQGAMLALSAETGDVAIRTDISKTFILSTDDPTVLINWKEILAPADAVQSVNGKTGNATLLSTDIAEGTNLYWTSSRFDSRLSGKSTSNLSEGTNLYYTDARANSAFDTRLATKSTADLTEGANLYYTDARANSAFDARLAAKTTSDLTEGSRLYWTQPRFDTALGLKSTSDLSEGTNLYFTAARARSALSATAPVAITSGVVSMPAATSSQSGYLTSGNWTTFNAKLGSATYTRTQTTRALNTNFTPSATSAVFACYSVDFTCSLSLAGTCTGTVELRSDSNATPTTVIGTAGNKLTLGLGIVVATTVGGAVQLCGLIRPNDNARLVSSGSASPSIVSQSEVAIGFAP